MTTFASDRELELRMHIHELLYQYALKHLTTDYIQWTHDAVSNVRIYWYQNE